MKNLLLFTFTIATTLCYLATDGKAESDIPRQADISVSGIYLSDPDSIRKMLGTSVTPVEPDNDFPIAVVCNSKSTEVLTLVFHYGSYRDSYSEFRVRSISKRPPNCIDSPKGGNHFITGKGIRLGISKRELINILGSGYSEKKEDHLIILQYKTDNVDTSRFIQKYDWSLYYGSYYFSKDKLVKFEFGFIYP
ncbi:MAG: hypothetical protein ACYC7L_05740 [Nitrospirota bacterium]